MFIDGIWIYWPEQCDYCQNENKCKYKKKIKNYFNKILAIDSKGCYGTLHYKCDYLQFDREKYYMKNFGENC